jgi:hypothetical protein
MTDHDDSTTTTHLDTLDAMSPDRRAALQKLGLITAWTAPTLLTLLRSARAEAESLPGTPVFGPTSSPDSTRRYDSLTDRIFGKARNKASERRR